MPTMCAVHVAHLIVSEWEKGTWTSGSLTSETNTTTTTTTLR